MRASLLRSAPPPLRALLGRTLLSNCYYLVTINSTSSKPGIARIRVHEQLKDFHRALSHLINGIIYVNYIHAQCTNRSELVKLDQVFILQCSSKGQEFPFTDHFLYPGNYEIEFLCSAKELSLSRSHQINIL